MNPAAITPTPTVTEGRSGSTPSPDTVGAMVLDAAARHSGVALEYRHAGRRVSITYPQLGARVTEIARGLIALGVQPGDRVSIFATIGTRRSPIRARSASTSDGSRTNDCPTKST